MLTNPTALSVSRYGAKLSGFYVLRTELMTRGAIGNKRFKLKANLAALRGAGNKRVLSFGGAWSNHLHALALCARDAGLASVGVVRGDERPMNALLAGARSYGMQIHYVDRKTYRQRHNTAFCEQLCDLHDCDTWLPEGGSNELAVSGCRTIAALIQRWARQQIEWNSPLVVVLAVGTGATLAGIASGLYLPRSQVIGIPVVRDPGTPGRIRQWISGTPDSRWSLDSPGEHRYGKADAELLRFIVSTHSDSGIALDPVYTGPALKHALRPAFIESLPDRARVVFVHTGGLTGVQGYRDQFYRGETSTDAIDNYLVQIDRLTRVG